ncbi:hypothetical protein AAMO2058_000943700 [Amorphochlora amoebiformis]
MKAPLLQDAEELPQGDEVLGDETKSLLVTTQASDGETKSLLVTNKESGTEAKSLLVTKKFKQKRRLTIDLTVENHMHVLRTNGGCICCLFFWCLSKAQCKRIVRRKISNLIQKQLKKNGIQSESEFPEKGPEIRVIVRHMNTVKQLALQQVIKFKIRVKSPKSHHSSLDSSKNI